MKQPPFCLAITELFFVFSRLVKRGIDRVEILAVQMLLRDAEGIGKISHSNKRGEFVVKALL